MKYALLLLSFILFLSRPALAAHKMRVASGIELTASSFGNHASRFGRPGESIWSNTDGVISFAAALVEVTLGLFLLSAVIFSPVALAGALTAAVVAVIFGIKGKRKRPRGFALAGFWTGLAMLGAAATIGLGILVVLLILSH